MQLELLEDIQTLTGPSKSPSALPKTHQAYTGRDVLICCRAAVSDQLTDLGSNVTINCDLDENEVYWILLKTPDPPTVILRSFPTSRAPFYSNKTFIKKYSVQFKHRLVINNVTADELGVYYCMNAGATPKLSNSTRLTFTESTQITECHNHAAVEFIDQNQKQSQIIIIISGLMNGLLLIVLIEGSRIILKCFHLDNMKIIQLQLYVLICCRAAVSDQLTDLGSNVTINCDLDENEVYWILQKTPDPPTVILRSMSTMSAPFYLNKTFRKKYSLQFKHRLVINNVTADELGVYYCMNTDTPPKLSNSTRLTFNESTQITEYHNHTAVEFIDQNQNQCQIIIIISGLMNGLLLIVLIGLVKVFVIGNRRSAEESQLNTDLQQTQVTEEHDLQYATMDFSKMRRNIRHSQINSTYAALNLPKS
ncbi:hypothetical protein F2P79_017110 [Pimephales promelas]|nr:hypothetical protein F2P79_017110 [Pimephales promelas]